MYNGESYPIPAYSDNGYETRIVHGAYQNRATIVEHAGQPLKRAIAPGERDTIAFNLIAPIEPGTYDIAFWMETTKGLQWRKKRVWWPLEVTE